MLNFMLKLYSSYSSFSWPIVIFLFLGLGKDLALKLESLGFTVYAGCLLPKGEGAKGLNEKNNGHMHILHLDVTSDGSVADAVQYVKKHSKDKGLYLIGRVI